MAQQRGPKPFETGQLADRMDRFQPQAADGGQTNGVRDREIMELVAVPLALLESVS